MIDLKRRKIVSAITVGAPLAAMLADPRLARAAASTLDDVTITGSDGGPIQAAIARPQQRLAPSVLLIHEWWGLNDQIKAVAADLARQGYIALAVDLYGGKATDSGEEAGKLMQAVDPRRATDALVSWIGWLKAEPAGTGKVATMGWCFGGGWALNAAIADPVDATVIYYGRVDQSVENLRRLRGPVIGHFAQRDTWITPAVVAAFEAAMKEAGKRLTVYWYDADHAFANPTSALYDAADAALAWQRSLDFLGNALR